jgi:hypothetical protein
MAEDRTPYYNIDKGSTLIGSSTSFKNSVISASFYEYGLAFNEWFNPSRQYLTTLSVCENGRPDIATWGLQIFPRPISFTTCTSRTYGTLSDNTPGFKIYYPFDVSGYNILDFTADIWSSGDMSYRYKRWSNGYDVSYHGNLDNLTKFRIEYKNNTRVFDRLSDTAITTNYTWHAPAPLTVSGSEDTFNNLGFCPRNTSATSTFRVYNVQQGAGSSAYDGPYEIAVRNPGIGKTIDIVFYYCLTNIKETTNNYGTESTAFPNNDPIVAVAECVDRRGITNCRSVVTSQNTAAVTVINSSKIIPSGSSEQRIQIPNTQPQTLYARFTNNGAYPSGCQQYQKLEDLPDSITLTNMGDTIPLKERIKNGYLGDKPINSNFRYVLAKASYTTTSNYNWILISPGIRNMKQLVSNGNRIVGLTKFVVGISGVD